MAQPNRTLRAERGRGLICHLRPRPFLSPTAAMAPPGTLGLVLLLLLAPGLAAAQSECSGCLPGPGPITALVVGDVILTLLIAGGAYWLAGRSRRASPKPRPPEPDSHYQELQGARGDIYSELKR